MTSHFINLSTAGITSKLTKRTSTRYMTDSLQTSCTWMLRKPKQWSSLQNITHDRTFSFTSTTKLLRELTNDITFLGIRISAKLSNIHVDVICKKVRRTIGLIHMNIHLAPEHLRHILYITLVCPILEYSCATWHPLTKTFTNRLVSVQRFACRVILQSWNLEHDDLLSRTSLSTFVSSSWLLNCDSCLQNSCQSLSCSQCVYSSHSFRFKM